MKKDRFYLISDTLKISLLGLILLLLMGCAIQKPIPVGFAGELTGRRSGMGVDSRDGAQLAIDIINEQGGINGRPLALITRDDKGDPDIAHEVDAELIEMGVVAILGHVTSQQTAAVLEQINSSDVILLSPTTSSDQFTGYADNFFRVMPATAVHGKAMARHIYQTRQIPRISGVYDLGNRAFSEILWNVIQTEFESLGGEVDQIFTFVSEETDLQQLAQEIAASQPQAVVFISSDVDTALLIQYIRQEDDEVPLFSSTWAQTNELSAKGGSAVEGLELNAIYNSNNTQPRFLEFSKRFEERYSRTPSFGSVFAYEAVLVLAEALKQTNGKSEGLKEALTAGKTVEGIQGDILLDQYGDVNREVYIAVVEDGNFNIVTTIRPE